MANRRQEMTPPIPAPSPYGLLTVASELPGTSHWELGTTWQEICPEGSRTYDQCLDPDAADSDSPPTSGVPKPEFEAVHLRGAAPFTVYTRFNCPAVGFGEDGLQDLTERALNRVSSFQVEQAFATGTASGDQVVFPFLQSDTQQTEDIYPGDDAVILAQAADVLTTDLVDPVEAIGRVEGALAECYKAQGVIHVPTGLLASLVAFEVATLRNGRYVSPAGHLYAVGDGYPGAAPDGTETEGQVNIYGTGQVWYHRSGVRSFPLDETLDRTQNSVLTLAERTYLVGYECCLFTIPVTLGGVVSGAFDAFGELAIE